MLSISRFMPLITRLAIWITRWIPLVTRLMPSINRKILSHAIPHARPARWRARPWHIGLSPLGHGLDLPLPLNCPAHWQACLGRHGMGKFPRLFTMYGPRSHLELLFKRSVLFLIRFLKDWVPARTTWRLGGSCSVETRNAFLYHTQGWVSWALVM